MIARRSTAAQGSLMHRLLQSAKWAELLWPAQRMALSIAKARRFAPQAVLQMKSSMALLCRPRRPFVPRESVPKAPASSQIAEQSP
jgi:hypothetical protein